jgi:zinc finger homeobox protein 3
MKHIFLEYRTPTMPECELLGKEIELQKRVVQVWFQNARAKEKKNPNFFKSDLPDEYQPSNDQCKLCQIKYTLQTPQRVRLTSLSLVTIFIL